MCGYEPFRCLFIHVVLAITCFALPLCLDYQLFFNTRHQLPRVRQQHYTSLAVFVARDAATRGMLAATTAIASARHVPVLPATAACVECSDSALSTV